MVQVHNLHYTTYSGLTCGASILDSKTSCAAKRTLAVVLLVDCPSAVRLTHVSQLPLPSSVSRSILDCPIKTPPVTLLLHIATQSLLDPAGSVLRCLAASKVWVKSCTSFHTPSSLTVVSTHSSRGVRDSLGEKRRRRALRKILVATEGVMPCLSAGGVGCTAASNTNNLTMTPCRLIIADTGSLSAGAGDHLIDITNTTPLFVVAEGDMSEQRLFISLPLIKEEEARSSIASPRRISEPTANNQEEKQKLREMM